MDEEDYEDPYEHWDDEDPEDMDEWVLDCGDPNCCMNFQYHYRSECHTPEMYEAMVAEFEEEAKCTCTFGESSFFHLPECDRRRTAVTVKTGHTP